MTVTAQIDAALASADTFLVKGAAWLLAAYAGSEKAITQAEATSPLVGMAAAFALNAAQERPEGLDRLVGA